VVVPADPQPSKRPRIQVEPHPTSSSSSSQSQVHHIIVLPTSSKAASTLILDFFTGMDGFGHALDHLGCKDCFPSKAVSILFEVDIRCRKLLNHHRVRPGIILSDIKDSANVVGSALAPLEDNDAIFKSLLSQLPLLELIVVSSGSPCVGFTRAKANHQGIKDPESEKIWVLPTSVSRLDAICKKYHPKPVVITYVGENVDMKDTPEDRANRDAISDTMKVAPEVIQASNRCATVRQRSFWTNLFVEEFTPNQVDVIQCLEPGWRPLWEFPSMTPKPEMRFATFLRPFAVGKPREFPAKYRRLSLHSYCDAGLVYRPDASAADKEKLTKIVKEGVRIRTNHIRESGSKSQIARGKVSDFIHQHGGDQFLRPLSGPERDRCLGFPSGASCLPSDGLGDASWGPHESTGNAFAVPVLSHILQPVAAFILTGRMVKVRPGLPTVTDKESALASLTPTRLSGNNARRSAPSAPAGH
jgi:hypothetical protein